MRHVKTTKGVVDITITLTEAELITLNYALKKLPGLYFETYSMEPMSLCPAPADTGLSVRTHRVDLKDLQRDIARVLDKARSVARKA